METNSPAVSYRAHLQQQIAISRRTLIGVIVLTLANLGLLLADGSTYLVFSVSVPYYLAWLGKAMDNNFSPVWTENGAFTATGLAIGVAILGVYLLLWLLSKKNGRWLWVAAGFLCLDLLALVAVAALVLQNIGGSLVEILIHIVVIGQIGKGASAWKKLQNQPPEISYTVVTDDL